MKVASEALKKVESLRFLSLLFIFFCMPKRKRIKRKRHFAEEFFAVGKNRSKTPRRYAPESRSFSSHILHRRLAWPRQVLYSYFKKSRSRIVGTVILVLSFPAWQGIHKCRHPITGSSPAQACWVWQKSLHPWPLTFNPRPNCQFEWLLGACEQ